MKEESQIEDMRAAIRGDRERAEQARQRSTENVRALIRAGGGRRTRAGREPVPEPVRRLFGRCSDRYAQTVDRRERERIMRQGVVLPETPRDRRNLDGLRRTAGQPAQGAALPLRYGTSAPMPTAISSRSAGHGRTWAAAPDRGADGRARAGTRGGPCHVGDDRAAWHALVEAWDFGDVNELIDRHNRWYPAESRLPMDPRTGDYALVNGKSYRCEPLDARWAFERFRSDASSVSRQSAAPNR